MTGLSDLEEILLTEQLNWYRLQRHDFMNHWQVIMGYLQLEQGDKALGYMREALGGLTAEQKVGQLAHPIAAAILLGMVIRLRSEEITARLQFPAEMTEERFWQDNWRQEYAPAFYGYTKKCVEGAVLRAKKEKGRMGAEIVLDKQDGVISCDFVLTCREIVLWQAAWRTEG